MGRTDEVEKEEGFVGGYLPMKGLEPCIILLICPTRKSPKGLVGQATKKSVCPLQQAFVRAISREAPQSVDTQESIKKRKSSLFPFPQTLSAFKR